LIETVEEFEAEVQWRKDSSKSVSLDKIKKCKIKMAREYGISADEINMGK
jgi:hypothetical protein